MEETDLNFTCADWFHERQTYNGSIAGYFNLACKLNLTVNNDTHDYEYDPIEDPLDSTTDWSVLWIFLVWFLHFVMFIVGLIGNLLVIYVVVRFRQMHTITNFYLANLAIADVGVILSFPFVFASVFLPSWPFGSLLCHLYFPVSFTNIFASSAFLVLIAIDRYLVVCHPSKAHKYRNSRNAIVCVVVTWTISFLTQAVPMIYATRTIRIDNKMFCAILFSLESNAAHRLANAVYFTLDSVVGFVIPIVVLAVLYTRIIKQLKCIRQHDNHEKSITRLLVVVVVVHFVCWTPIRTIHFMADVLSIIKLENVSHVAYYFADWLYFANSAVNPILYAFLSDSFQKSFRKAFCCTKTQGIEPRNSRSAASHLEHQTTVFHTSYV